MDCNSSQHEVNVPQTQDDCANEIPSNESPLVQDYESDSAWSRKDYVYIESDKSLKNTKVQDDAEAYKLYNDLSWDHGFGIRRQKRTLNAKGKVTVLTLCCHRQGFKRDNKSTTKAFNKIEIRTGCKAFIRYHVVENDEYLVVDHEMEHNHPMVPLGMRHLITSHRGVGEEALETVVKMAESGVGVATAFRLIAKEVGGEANVEYTQRDVYNALAKYKNSEFGGCDAKQLLNLLSTMQVQDKDFFYEIEIDNEGHIKSIFYRDGRMKRDFDIFGDVVVFDTTFNTNKWGMLLAPFVGINHNSKNAMFGVGFVPKEDNDSMVWLFHAFKKSVDNKAPESFMTDQSATIAFGLDKVFPQSKHRLCTWHIEQNAKRHLKKYWCKKGFSRDFNYVLKYTNTVGEFETFWKGMVEKYQCGDCDWIKNLHNIRQYWCPAYNKEKFSGGILSSQKCESTNNSVKRRISKSDTLVDVYKVIKAIISEWRERENAEDYDSLTGEKAIAYGKVPILLHARRIYTMAMACYFERQYIKANECSHEEIDKPENNEYRYRVWREVDDRIMHQVSFNKQQRIVYCTCRMYPEVGILCQHALKIFIVHSISEIPAPYIKKRWTKEAMCMQQESMYTHSPYSLEVVNV